MAQFRYLGISVTIVAVVLLLISFMPVATVETIIAERTITKPFIVYEEIMRQKTEYEPVLKNITETYTVLKARNQAIYDLADDGLYLIEALGRDYNSLYWMPKNVTVTGVIRASLDTEGLPPSKITFYILDSENLVRWYFNETFKYIMGGIEVPSGYKYSFTTDRVGTYFIAFENTHPTYDKLVYHYAEYITYETVTYSEIEKRSIYYTDYERRLINYTEYKPIPSNVTEKVYVPTTVTKIIYPNGQLTIPSLIVVFGGIALLVADIAIERRKPKTP